LANAQTLKNIQIFYHDKETNKGKDTYRELTSTGDDAVFSKPENIDVILSFNPSKDKTTDKSNEELEILIEELYEPENGVKISRNECTMVKDGCHIK
jgi:hypothetical protein